MGKNSVVEFNEKDERKKKKNSQSCVMKKKKKLKNYYLSEGVKFKFDLNKADWHSITSLEDTWRKKVDIKSKNKHFRAILFSLTRQIPYFWGGKNITTVNTWILLPKDIYIYSYIYHFVESYYDQLNEMRTKSFWNPDLKVEKRVSSITKVLFRIFNSKQKEKDFIKQFKEFEKNDGKGKLPPIEDKLFSKGTTDGMVDATLTFNEINDDIQPPYYEFAEYSDTPLEHTLHMSHLKVYISKKYKIKSTIDNIEQFNKDEEKLEKNS